MVEMSQVGYFMQYYKAGKMLGQEYHVIGKLYHACPRAMPQFPKPAAYDEARRFGTYVCRYFLC